MEQSENQAVIAFDTLYTNNHIQILKVLLPYFDAQSRKKLAILIKFMELRYTMEYFSRHAALESAAQNASGESAGQPDIVRIFEQIKNFCTPSERAMFDQLTNMKKSMEMYEEMMGMMQLFSQLTPEGTMPFSSAGAGTPSDFDSEKANPEADRFENAGTAFDADHNAKESQNQEGQNFASHPNGQSTQQASPFGSANPMDMLKGMLSPEQQAMFEMFRSSFGNTD